MVNTRTDAVRFFRSRCQDREEFLALCNDSVRSWTLMGGTDSVSCVEPAEVNRCAADVVRG